jgi:hypothetical protein
MAAGLAEEHPGHCRPAGLVRRLSYAYYDPLRLIFAIIFLVGGAVILLASYHAHGKRIGFYPSAMLMYAGLAILVLADDSFQFFAAWELLTVGSYFLILRGKESEAACPVLSPLLAGRRLPDPGRLRLAPRARQPGDLAALATLAQPLGPGCSCSWRSAS